MAKFDPFLSLDCAPTPSTLAQSKKRKGSNFAIWQPWHKDSHKMAQAQKEKNERLKAAFGIAPEFVEGSSFNENRQAIEEANRFVAAE